MATYTSTISRVLAIPELLDMVFQFLDDASNASNARVSKQWSEMALDVLWKEVTNFYGLFNILSPLEKGSSGLYKFVRPLEPSDWIRFERYRRRVRKVTYCGSKSSLGMHHSVFDDIARSRTNLDILPNSYSLLWNAPINLCVIFMHKNVKCLALHLPSDTSNVSRTFEEIAARMPGLIELDLRFEFSISNIESDLIRMLPCLHSLRRIILPRFCLTTKIAEATSRLGKLQTLEYQYYDYQGRGDPVDIIDFEPVLSEGSFVSLSDMSTTITFQDAVRFFTVPFSPSNLTIVWVDSPTIENPPALLSLISTLASTCQLLKSLTLVSLIDSSILVTSAPEKEDCITIDTLRPLFKFPNLTSFTIEHHNPVHLDLSDVEEIAKSWPGVETLVLSTQPAYLEHSNLTLRALLPFAQHCPKLKMLGLFIDATATDIPSGDPAAAYQLPYFRALRLLQVGVSIIEEEGPVALFLSQVCPLNCDIEKGMTWDESILTVAPIVETLQKRFDKWEKVEELLPLLTKLRIEERERARLLKEEVQDLRIRTEVLMDKFAVAGSAVNIDGCILI